MDICRVTERRFPLSGFSLIEQIMVLAIAAVLVSVAAPSLGPLLGRNRVQMAQMDLIANLQHARQVSVMRGQRVVFCPSRDGRRCSGETRWESGWLLGDDGDGDHQPDGNPLRVGNGYGSDLTISSNQGRPYVRFSPDGMASGSNATLLICARGQSKQALSVVVSNSGRIRGAPATEAQASACPQSGQPAS